jgi:hypothetical protein
MAHYHNVMILETQNVTSFSLTSNAVCSLPIQDSYNSPYPNIVVLQTNLGNFPFETEAICLGVMKQ